MEKKNFESIFLLFETNKNCFLNVFLFTTQSFIIIICFYVKKKFWWITMTMASLKRTKTKNKQIVTTFLHWSPSCTISLIWWWWSWHSFIQWINFNLVILENGNFVFIIHHHHHRNRKHFFFILLFLFLFYKTKIDIYRLMDRYISIIQTIDSLNLKMVILFY